MKLNDKAKDFLKCLPVSREYGFADLSVLTHAWHESGGFVKIIGLNNYWGIKKPSQSVWHGLVSEVSTHEYEPMLGQETNAQALMRIIKKYGVNNATIIADGKHWKVFLPQKFRDWPTCEQALLWYCDFIKRLYPLAFGNRMNPVKYFSGLVEGKLKYATDPRYVKKLTELYEYLRPAL